MHRWTLLVVALGMVVATLSGASTAYGSTPLPPPLASPLPAQQQSPPMVTSLAWGCNPVSLTFPDGTPADVVIRAIIPDGPVVAPPIALWRLDAAAGRFEGASAAAPQASSLSTVNFLDATLICMEGSGIIAMPQVVAGSGVRTVTLVAGCNLVAVTFYREPELLSPSGVRQRHFWASPDDVFDAVILDTPGTPITVWRYETADRRFRGASSAAPQAGDLPQIDFLDAVMLCLESSGAIALPRVTAAVGPTFTLVFQDTSEGRDPTQLIYNFRIPEITEPTDANWPCLSANMRLTGPGGSRAIIASKGGITLPRTPARLFLALPKTAPTGLWRVSVRNCEGLQVNTTFPVFPVP